MISNHREFLIDNLLNNSLFPLTPYNPNPDPDILFIFNFFKNLNLNLILNDLEKHFNHNNIINALDIIFHYKGPFSYFNDKIDFNTYIKIRPYLDKQSDYNFTIKHHKIIIKKILNNEKINFNTKLLDYLLTHDIKSYIDISLKLELDNIHKVFSTNKSEIFYWINNHKYPYNELIKLNKPEYIFNNMNGKLNINNDSLKYFFEICPPNIEIYRDLKKNISIKDMWKFSKHKLSVEFFLEIVDTFDELLIILNFDNIPLKSMEVILNKIKNSYPLIYENFNSLLLMKKKNS